MNKSMRRRFKLIFLISCTIVMLLMGLTVGGASIPIRHVFHVLLYRLAGIQLPQYVEVTTVGLIWNIRLPRVLLSFVVGSSLAVSGSVMQSVLKNPLASSYTIGVSAGAGLGAIIVISFGISASFLGMFLMPVFAIVFGMLTIMLAMVIAKRVSTQLSDYSIILVGMILSVFITAMIRTLASKNASHAQQILRWQLGSFALRGWVVVGIVSGALLLLICCLLHDVKEMDVLTFGDEQASAIGIEVAKTKWRLIMLSTMLTGVAVAFVGMIDFIDLIAPHVIRRFFGSEHRYVIPLSALFGGLFMVFSDLIARTILAPSELPVGTVTALMGAPFFAYLFLKNGAKKRREL